MSGPWEKYAAPAAPKSQGEARPWEKYGAKPPEPQAAESPGLWDQLRRQLGLAARIGVQGGTDLASLPGDIAVALFNLGNQKPYEVTLDDGTKAMRGGPLQMPSEARDELLTRAGLPEPETASERVVNIAGRGMVGAGGTAKVAGALPGELAAAMASRPALQTVSGATGGGAAGVAREEGAGPVGQTIAGLAGALAPAAVTPRAPVMTATLSPQQLAQARAAAEAAASARATPGVAAGEAVVNAAPEMRATGGGYTFGTVGPDESAGLNATTRQIAERGREIGMRMTPGQATGSRALQQIEAKLESQPMTSGPFNTIKANNARALNRASAANIGEASDVVDSNVLARATDRISGVYENVADDVPRQIEPRGFIGFLSGLQDETRGLVQGLTSHPLVEDVIGFAREGAATGRQLQSLASKLGKAAFKNMSTPSGDRDLGMALYRVKDYVDDLLAQGLSEERAAVFNQARGEYRNLMLLTQRTGVVNPSTGNVSGRSLANVLQGKDRRGYLYGENRSPMYDAARFSQAFAPIVGDSGTATRMPLQGVTDMLMRVPLNVATRMYTSSPSVDLAVRAQAASRSAANMARSLRKPLGPADVPAGGAAAATQGYESSRDAAKRRAMAEALRRRGAR